MNVHSAELFVDVPVDVSRTLLAVRLEDSRSWGHRSSRHCLTAIVRTSAHI